ncbi:hypothetical protein C1886_23310 [Pseudomonas sp. FW300-N1A1]|nr:hypothetical protein C1886_23310 [Pseudomonas sp. FW300-N1A1]
MMCRPQDRDLPAINGRSEFKSRPVETDADFSILEIVEKPTSTEKMKLKESHWKQWLLTRDSVLNGN